MFSFSSSSYLTHVFSSWAFIFNELNRICSCFRAMGWMFFCNIVSCRSFSSSSSFLQEENLFVHLLLILFGTYLSSSSRSFWNASTYRKRPQDIVENVLKPMECCWCCSCIFFLFFNVFGLNVFVDSVSSLLLWLLWFICTFLPPLCVLHIVAPALV